VSKSRLSLTGTLGTNSGNSIQTITGLVPVSPVADVLFPNLLVLYHGNSLSFAGYYQSTNRLRIRGGIRRTQYQTTNNGVPSDNMLKQYDVRVEYDFRQLRFDAGFIRVSQGVGTIILPTTVNTIYFGVTRHFDLF
jgi:hypothetical protein